MTQLTPHFSLEELTQSQTASRKGIPNIPSPKSAEYNNLQKLADVLEKVRTTLNSQPILISSGYRSPKVNKAVGGSKFSAHMSGLAADFICPSFGSPLQVCRAIEPNMAELGIDQLIYEYETWVHLGLAIGSPPRHMALTIDSKGARTGFA